MASAATVAVAGCFISPLISKLLDHHILNWKEKKVLKKGLGKETKSLHGILLKIKGIVEVAEEKQFEKEDVRGWLRELKDVLYDAEDVLDMYEVDLLLKKQRDTEPTSSKKKVSFPFSSLRSSEKSKDGAPSSSRLSVAKDIKGIRERLDEILKQGIDFGLTDMVRSAPQIDPELFTRRETSCYLQDDESTFVGRDDVKEEIIKHLVPSMEVQVRRPSSNTGGHGVYWLWTNFTRLLHSIYWLLLRFIHLFLRGTRNPSDDGRKFLVLPIVGMGGVGKTTLAQLVFNDKKVVAFYKTRAWVCLGQSHDLDPSQTTGKIIESVRSFRRNNEACSFSTLQALQATLLDEIEEPFLLVLDDAWDTVKEAWDKLLGPLKATRKRCRVIVTMRDEKVADAFHDILHVRRLNLLDNNSMWSIFKKSAFDTENATRFPKLETIGRLIVQRLQGLPLAAKIIGGILRGNRNEGDWSRILESEHLVNDNHGENYMLSILMLSYHNLPVIMKQYFSCFSLFPKDYEFCRYARCDEYRKDSWMIERVLLLIEAGIYSKYNASHYVDGLLSRSLLQSSKDSYGGGRVTISMHDLIHDMAELLSKEEFLRISDAHKKGTIPKKIRHISFFQKIFDPNSAILKELKSYESLRTLLYTNINERMNGSEDLLDGWLTNLKYLRILTLYNNWITILPDSIGTLKLLCYLDLLLPKLKELPETISELCRLKELNLRGCNNLRELPSSITRLINLIHLDVDTRLLKKVDGIGQFTNLQELEEFHVEEEKGHEIVELKNMNKLCGSLSIYNLERVNYRENAQEAQLDQKKNLERLLLCWNDYALGESLINIMEGLRPSTGLKELFIYEYRGTRLPDWLTSSSLISLHCLELTGCPNLVEIPSLPCTLRSLQLCCSGVRTLFSSSSTICLPSLQSLKVIRCSELDESLNVLLKASLPSLEYLKIIGYNCPLDGLSCVTTVRELELCDCKEKVILNPAALISLRRMQIFNCPNIVVQGHSSDSELCDSSLISLTARKCPMLLESLSQCGVFLTSLTELKMKLRECDDSTLYKCLCNATALERLHLESCVNITSLPSELMHKLAAIKELNIRDCPNLVKLEFPPVVKISITLWDCPNLLFKRSPPLVNTVINRLEISGFSEEQLSGLFSISQNTPIQSIMLKECKITDDVVTSILGGICRNTTLEVLEIEACEVYLLDFSSLKNLRWLTIRRCPAITSLPVLSSLDSLKYLSIEDCGNLAFTWGEASTPLFPSLESLGASGFSKQQLIDLMKVLIKSPIRCIIIEGCIELESFDGDLQSSLLACKNSLEQLSIRDSPNLRCLPTHLEVFVALRYLVINKCPEISTLPEGLPPTSLYTLDVVECPALEALYKDGNQWLSNIPRVFFLSECVRCCFLRI